MLEDVGLPDGNEPVIAMISRLVEHKGFDLVKCVFDEIVSLGFKVVILGSGEKAYEEFSSRCITVIPTGLPYLRIYSCIGDENLCRCGYVLMPSKSEPCGLAQMISMRYGTVPIVRATGGLKDSVSDYGENGNKGLGFTFQTYNALDMLGAVTRASEIYGDKKKWAALVNRDMKADFSWKRSAKLYLGLYSELCSK